MIYTYVTMWLIGKSPIAMEKQWMHIEFQKLFICWNANKKTKHCAQGSAKEHKNVGKHKTNNKIGMLKHHTAAVYI